MSMRSGSKVFLDSGIFIALLDRSDRHHRAADDLFGGTRPRWVTSLPVIAETYSWFLHRLGEDAARAFRLALADFTGLKLLALEHVHHQETMARLERLRGNKLTYVDASSLVFLGREGIRTVWGTDRHLAIEGATVLPAHG
jgi:predicted nucleic acid-binding protein